MIVIAVYSMKGGVGKTTTAVNLSHLAAAGGQRALLWDLDPQAASSFAFRIRPRVAGFGRKSLQSGQALAGAIKATDYDHLDLLPADFAYRKLDRLLEQVGKPERVVTTLIDTLGRDYDVVFLDCPAGFSLLTEGVLAAADAVLVPSIPTVLSLRTVARLIKWADRAGSRFELAAFFNMVDRRKVLHRRACEWQADHPQVFLSGQIPYASVVEQIAVRRMPLAVFAAKDSATTAFAAIWAELQARLRQRGERVRPGARWAPLLLALESLVAQLESPDGRGIAASGQTPPIESQGGGTSPAPADVHFVHSFDTDGRDLQRNGHVLELRERAGSLLIVAQAGHDVGRPGADKRAQAQIDNWCAMQILSGRISPLTALERKLGPPVPPLIGRLRNVVGGRDLRRMSSRVAGHGRTERPDRAHPDSVEASVVSDWSA